MTDIQERRSATSRPTAVVDWEALEHSWLSSRERAAVVVARGVAAAERRGGWPPELHRVLSTRLPKPPMPTGCSWP